MAKVIVGAAMSLDGFINDQHGDVSRLYPDLDALRETETLRASIAATGAVVMGRRAFDMARGDLTGYEYQVPIFVVTHRPPEYAVTGENERLRVHYVAEGVARAVEQAKAAAGERDVTVVGGASTAQQSLRVGLADEVDIHLVPVLLGNGLRLFEHLGAAHIELEPLWVVEYPWFTSLRYRILK